MTLDLIVDESTQTSDEDDDILLTVLKRMATDVLYATRSTGLYEMFILE